MNIIQALASQLGGHLTARGMTVTTAESCTGGGVAHAITMIPGSSNWFESGFITYSNRAKQQQLGVNAATLLRYGAVSEEVVKAMVTGALQISNASAGIAVSGIAGPAGGSREKPVGSVWFAWRLSNGTFTTAQRQFAGNREAIRNQSIEAALRGLDQIINNNAG